MDGSFDDFFFYCISVCIVNFSKLRNKIEILINSNVLHYLDSNKIVNKVYTLIQNAFGDKNIFYEYFYLIDVKQNIF